MNWLTRFFTGPATFDEIAQKAAPASAKNGRAIDSEGNVRILNTFGGAKAEETVAAWDRASRIMSGKEQINEETEEIHPTAHTKGSFTGWRVEAKDPKTGKWEPIELLKLPDGIGVERAHHTGEAYSMANLFSYEAAMALAWQIKANDLVGLQPARVIPYKTKYKVEWTREPDDQVEEI